MNAKYVYSAVLLLVLSAWFGHSSIKPLASTSSQDKVSNEIVSQLVEDVASIGVKPGEWLIGGKCNLEYLNETMMNANVNPVSNDKNLKFVGWAMDVDKVRLPTKVIVRFTDENKKDIYAMAQTGLARLDVREYFDLPEIVNASGFALVTNFRDYPVGQYSLTLIVFYDDISYICDSDRKINVRK